MAESDGKKLWEHVGYKEGGPEAVMQAIRSKTAFKPWPDPFLILSVPPHPDPP
jgi:hypothetical protein